MSHVYCSPFLSAAPEANNGYAIVDPGRIDERLGGAAGWRSLVEATLRRDIRIMVDVVPNHMAVSFPANRWLWDVLENGRTSRYAAYFDIDWDPPFPSARDKILLPLLGDDYRRELEEGRIRLEASEGGLQIRYHDHVFPTSPDSIAGALGAAGERDGITTAVEAINRDPDELDRLLDLQHYRLARWRVANQALGYRRFFDVDSLIGLRVEDPRVFLDAHSLIVDWVRSGEVDGLRIDHPDGLRRPGEYLTRLRGEAPDAWIVVEKILEGDETLPPAWPVDGTTGYEFLNEMTALLVDPEGEAPLTDLWVEMSGTGATWQEVSNLAKQQVVHDVLSADLNRLTRILADVVRRRRRDRDFTLNDLAGALAGVSTSFDVYRTYVPEAGGADTGDRYRIVTAIDRARDGAPGLDEELFDLLEGILTGELEGTAETELRMRFQQLTGPVMAKGVEDTAFYRYSRLVALCEVGGDPGCFGLSDLERFHSRRGEDQQNNPRTLLALSTHDTKRSEDVRARLAVLSEIPHRWSEAVMRWRSLTARYRPPLLDGATEYLAYQTAVGAYPLPGIRLTAYLAKATKEAKVHTSWTDPDNAYDDAVESFAMDLSADEEFHADLAEFVRPVVAAGQANSLAQKAIQLTAPGVPDIYQGTELWDLSLVDPDNRRPVDHERRRTLLSALESLTAPEIMDRMDEGLPKLWLIHTLLHLRRRHPAALGADGGYLPLSTVGPAADHAVTYLRGEEVAVVVPRLGTRLAERGGWADTAVELPPGTWIDVLTGQAHQGAAMAAALFVDVPVAILEMP